MEEEDISDQQSTLCESARFNFYLFSNPEILTYWSPHHHHHPASHNTPHPCPRHLCNLCCPAFHSARPRGLPAGHSNGRNHRPEGPDGHIGHRGGSF